MNDFMTSGGEFLSTATVPAEVTLAPPLPPGAGAEVWQLIKRLLTRQVEIITIVRITFLLVCSDHISLRTR
jgi:hypothetical protein